MLCDTSIQKKFCGIGLKIPFFAWRHLWTAHNNFNFINCKEVDKITQNAIKEANKFLTAPHTKLMTFQFLKNHKQKAILKHFFDKTKRNPSLILMTFFCYFSKAFAACEKENHLCRIVHFNKKKLLVQLKRQQKVLSCAEKKMFIWS